MGQGGPVWREVGHGTGGSPSPGEAPEVGCTAGRVPVPKKHARDRKRRRRSCVIDVDQKLT